MRDFKFRGRLIDSGVKNANGKWQYGGIHVCKSYTVIITEPWALEMKVDPVTVGQYTGLKDKNGNEIYEGDIIKIAEGYTAIILWDIKKASFYIKGITGSQGKSEHLYGAFLSEVIGNIYENPELLEVSNEITETNP